MLGNLLCRMGFHRLARHEKWTPSILAPIVTEFEQKLTCTRCGKVTHHVHFKWDGKEMVKV